MATENPTLAIPREVFQNIETVQAQVEALQRELSQAMDVWSSTLASEKEKFDSLISRKEMAVLEQDEQWASRSKGYEEQLAQMRADFEARLLQAEQNASRALSELDETWQREKLEWGPEAQSQWPRERQALETKVQGLEAKLSQLESERAAHEARPSNETVQALEQQLREFQETVSQLQERASKSDELVNACVQALDYQISVLYDLIHHHADLPPNAGSDVAQS